MQREQKQDQQDHADEVHAPLLIRHLLDFHVRGQRLNIEPHAQLKAVSVTITAKTEPVVITTADRRDVRVGWCGSRSYSATFRGCCCAITDSSQTMSGCCLHLTASNNQKVVCMDEQFVCQMIVRLLPTSFPQSVLRRHHRRWRVEAQAEKGGRRERQRFPQNESAVLSF